MPDQATPEVLAQIAAAQKTAADQAKAGVNQKPTLFDLAQQMMQMQANQQQQQRNEFESGMNGVQSAAAGDKPPEVKLQKTALDSDIDAAINVYSELPNYQLVVLQFQTIRLLQRLEGSINGLTMALSQLATATDGGTNTTPPPEQPNAGS